MIISDFHTHSSNSGDSDTKMQLQIEAAIKKGITQLCITEHMDIDYPAPPKGHEADYCDFNLDCDSYKNEFDEMYKKYCTSSITNKDFCLYYGVELGLQAHIADLNREFLSGKSFDFVIASSHVLDHEDPYYPSYWNGKNEPDVFNHYFESIYENICLFDNFDVYGHIDYIVRYGHSKDYSYSSVSDVIDSILKKLIESGKGIEINTGGLRSGLKYPNPCPDVLRRYRELGGEIITIGSDAHVPEHIAFGFDIAGSILKDCGFKYYTIFKNRKPMFLML